jgi:hypothetical protein
LTSSITGSMAASGGVRAAHDDEERCGPSLCLLLLLRTTDFPFVSGAQDDVLRARARAARRDEMQSHHFE